MKATTIGMRTLMDYSARLKDRQQISEWKMDPQTKLVFRNK
jgi:hypothetical protein